MRAIFYDGRTAAYTDCDQVVLSDRVAVLERDHPLRRFISAVCVFSCEADAGNVPGGWNSAGAELYARALLMPTELFDPLDLKLFDHELAELFSVPLEQVEARREDLLSRRATGG